MSDEMPGPNPDDKPEMPRESLKDVLLSVLVVMIKSAALAGVGLVVLILAIGAICTVFISMG